MNNDKQDRVDEVSQYYKPAEKLAVIEAWLFWLTAAVSLSIPYSAVFGVYIQNIFYAVFLSFVVAHFSISQFSRFHLVPKAEHKRRQQMLSDAFGTPLSHDTTSLYYNNNYSPSVMRLGANIMENSLFSKEIVAKMLVKSRIITGSYIITWVFIFALRHDNINVLVWVTQLVFSGAIVVQWLHLEILTICSIFIFYMELVGIVKRLLQQCWIPLFHMSLQKRRQEPYYLQKYFMS